MSQSWSSSKPSKDTNDCCNEILEGPPPKQDELTQCELFLKIEERRLIYEIQLIMGLPIYTPEEMLLQKRHNLDMQYLLLAFFSAYQRGIAAGDFYEEPIGDDFIYPDW